MNDGEMWENDESANIRSRYLDNFYFVHDDRGAHEV